MASYQQSDVVRLGHVWFGWCSALYGVGTRRANHAAGDGGLLRKSLPYELLIIILLCCLL